MPQLVGLMLIGAGIYAGYRAFARARLRMSAELARAEEDLRRHAAEAGGDIVAKDLGQLIYDPVSGVYRPTKGS